MNRVKTKCEVKIYEIADKDAETMREISIHLYPPYRLDEAVGKTGGGL